MQVRTYPVAESLKQKLFDNHSPQEIETTIASLQMCLSPDHNNFIEFLKNKSQTSNNWKFWSQFVLQDGLAYVGMYLAIRGGNWNLRLACMKLMVPLFCAYDHMTYKRLISRHICDVLNLPTTVLQSLSEGGFVASITGAQWHSVAIDEAHEMLINKSCKMSVVHPTEDYIHRISNYMPYRSKCLENLKKQLFPEEINKIEIPQSFQSAVSNTKIGHENIKVLKSHILNRLLPDGGTSVLHNPYTNKTATNSQQEDLLNFRYIGER